MFYSADAAAEDQYARDVRLHDQEKAWFGFILKHTERDEYVASELIPVSDARNDVFQPQSLFGVTSTPPGTAIRKVSSAMRFFTRASA